MLAVRAVALALAIFSLQCAAAPFAVQLGDTRIAMDAPPGFSDTGFASSPRLAELAESTTSASNRVLLFAITDADLRRFMSGETPEFRRYITAVTPRGMEHERVGAESFRLYVGDSLAELGAPPPPGEVARYLDSQPQGKASLLAELRKDAEVVTVLQGTRLPSQERGTTWGGVFGMEKPRYAITTTTLMLLRGKALNFSVYSLYEGADDVQWIRTITTRWIEEIRRLNNR
jgi:hypothetical protein